MKMRKMEKTLPWQSTCATFPPPTPPCDRKVNADKFHDLTNAAEINTATCNSRSESCGVFAMAATLATLAPCPPSSLSPPPSPVLLSFDNINVNVINKTGSRFLRVRPLKSLTFKCAFLLCTSPGGATGYTFATFKLCLGAAATSFVELRQFFAVSSTLPLKFALSLSLLFSCVHLLLLCFACNECKLCMCV